MNLQIENTKLPVPNPILFNKGVGGGMNVGLGVDPEWLLSIASEDCLSVSILI